MGSLADASGIKYPGVPTSLGDQEQWLRLIAVTLNNVLQGKLLATGAVTLGASVGSTTLTDSRIGPNSFIAFMPTTANAATEIGAGTLYVSARTTGIATLTHANNAQTDRVFTYLVIG